MFRAYYHIAKNTFRENLRQPIYLLILTVGLTLIGTSPAFTLFVFRRQLKLVTDTSLATTLFFGWILAVLIASHSITREIQGGTATLVLSKPVNRGIFILGKVKGIVAALTLFCLILGTASLMAVRTAADQFNFDPAGFGIFFLIIVLSFLGGGIVNFLKKSSFPMATVLWLTILFPVGAFILRWIPVQGETLAYRWEVFPALLLVMFAVWMLGILATALSTRLELVPNMIVCAAIFICGLMSDYFLGGAAQESVVAGAVYALIPNWQLFWMADALAAGKSIPPVYVLWGAVYVILFGTLFTLFAFGLFAHREVGENTEF
ncbi:MAG: ABC transporter permease subunit [Verrucomicrobiota bacterium]